MLTFLLAAAALPGAARADTPFLWDPSVPAAEPLVDQALRFLGRLHPMAVHLPIGLLLAAALCECLSWRFDRLRVAARACLALGAAGAVVAAGMGWLYAAHEPQSRDALRALEAHRWTGVATAAAALIACALCARAAGGRPLLQAAYRYALFGSVLLVACAGHVGGSLVYGEDYALRAFAAIRRADRAAVRPAPGQPPAATESPSAGAGPMDGSAPPADVDFETHIRPLFEAHCIECHGPDEQEGDLWLHERSGAFQGDPSSWVIVPGQPDASLLLELVSLPPDDPDFMPAEGEPLSEEEIARLRAWIAAGAPWPEPAAPRTSHETEAGG